MIRNGMFGIVVMLLVTAFAASSGAAQTNGLVTLQSKSSFDQTVDQLRQLVAKNGMMVLSDLNQGKVMEMTGLKINAISLFVGNPTVGNKLFSADRGVGIAIPIRVNIYDNNDGKTYVSYVTPSTQLAAFKNDDIAKTAKMLDEKLSMLTGMLTK
jgi:uncharacterized protein (DUF302 family)